MDKNPSEEHQAHLRDYWRLVWRGKWIVLAVLLVVATLVAMVTLLQTPIYRATAEVLISPRPKTFSPAADFTQLGVSSWSWGAEERYLNTQMEILRSREIAQAVLDSSGLLSSPRFAGLSDPAGALARRVQLEVLLDTYVLEVSIEDPDPEMAQLLANLVSKAYVEMNFDAALSNARRVIDELNTQLDPLRASIRQRERERLDLARGRGLYVPESEESTTDSRLRQIQEELTEVRIALGKRQAALDAIEEIERGGGSYETIPEVANSVLILELKQEAINLQQQVEELSQSYREGHPRLAAAQAALAELPGKIQAETEKIIAKIKTENAIDERRKISLEAQLAEAREDGLSQAETEGMIEILDSELQEERRIYGLITSRIKEINLNLETQVNNTRILEEAILPTSPVRPRKALNLMAGLLLGLILGLGTVFLVDYLDNTIKSAEDVEQYLKLPLLAMVPRTDKDAGHTTREAFQTLRTSILFASKGRKLKTLLVTSAGPGEGKSMTSVQLAQTLAAAGDSVVLVDGDLRRPTVHGRLGLPRSDGLTNCLLDPEGAESWKRYLKDAPGIDTLKVLTCGPLPPNPAELFSSERFLEVLGQLRESFSWVIIDSPPLASLSDSVVLGSMVEMTVVVIKHNQNDRELIRRAVGQLRKVGATLVGVVLNNVDLRRAGYHDYYYAGYSYEARDESGQDTVKKKRRFAGQKRS